MTISIVLPFPISVNAMYSNVGKKRIKSNRYKAWKTAAQWDVKSQFKGAMSHGDVMVQIALRQPSNKKRDLDNLAKACLDVLTGTVIRDDDQVKLLCMWWGDNKKDGEALIMVDPITCPTAQAFLQSHAKRFEE